MIRMVCFYINDILQGDCLLQVLNLMSKISADWPKKHKFCVTFMYYQTLELVDPLQHLYILCYLMYYQTLELVNPLQQNV